MQTATLSPPYLKMADRDLSTFAILKSSSLCSFNKSLNREGIGSKSCCELSVKHGSGQEASSDLRLIGFASQIMISSFWGELLLQNATATQLCLCGQ